MARREEGEYSTYSTDEQRRQRVKDQARWEQNGPVEALGDLRRGEVKLLVRVADKIEDPEAYDGREEAPHGHKATDVKERRDNER